MNEKKKETVQGAPDRCYIVSGYYFWIVHFTITLCLEIGLNELLKELFQAK